MSLDFPTSQFGFAADGTNKALSYDDKLPGRSVYFDHFPHKVNASLRPLLTGLSTATGTAVANHAAHSHQGGVTGEFIVKTCAAGQTHNCIGFYDLGSDTDATWHEMQSGDYFNSPFLAITPPGADSARMTFYVGTASITTAYKRDYIQIAAVICGTDASNTNATPIFDMYYPSREIRMGELPATVDINIHRLAKMMDTGPSNPPMFMFYRIYVRRTSFEAAGGTAKIVVKPPTITAYRLLR